MTQNKPIRILVADDDAQIRSVLQTALEAEGFEVVCAENGREAVEKATEDISLCLLDIMMPVMSGIEACKEMRKSSHIPIIMISAKNDDIDEIIGLELGADDYIDKPINMRLLIARIKAVLRRSQEYETKAGRDEVNIGGLVVDVSRFSVTLMGERISCTPKELDILYMLASNPGHVYTRDDLLTQIWGYEFSGETRTVDTHIKRIRAKLDKPDFKWAIKTIYGVGYKFEQK